MMPRALIAGLGNPGKQYTKTRHNLGFFALDTFAQKHGLVFQKEKRWKALVAQGVVLGRAVALMKPQTYMNLSGDAIFPWMEERGTLLRELLVVVDDTALPFGVCRTRLKGSSGGHNGLKSIESFLKSQEFARLRIGIGSTTKDLAEYVLEAFSLDELEALPKVLKTAVSSMEEWLLRACLPDGE